MSLLADTQSSISHLSIGIPKFAFNTNAYVDLKETSQFTVYLSAFSGRSFLLLVCWRRWRTMSPVSAIQEQTVERSMSPGNLFTFMQTIEPVSGHCRNAWHLLLVSAGPLFCNRRGRGFGLRKLWDGTDAGGRTMACKIELWTFTSKVSVGICGKSTFLTPARFFEFVECTKSEKKTYR
jgi:hypothetical protein